MSDPLAAMIQALGQKPPGTKNDWELLPRQPRSTANVNNPFKPEARRLPREGDPAKWSPPAYRDREAERIVGRLSKKEKP